MELNKIPFFQEIEDSQNILLAGAGGGFDIFSGIPLYFNLKKQGKNITIANFSFTLLHDTSSEQVFPNCYKIKSADVDTSGRNYFPEKYLGEWFESHGEEVDVFGFNRTGINPLTSAYEYLIKTYNIDTIILIDGGTDSLMFGDEEGLGTPQEDICSMAAVYKTGIKKQYLLSVGFGVDHFHGVSHYRFLENVSTLIKDGGYLGLFQMTKEMEESKQYVHAMEFVNEKMKDMESIVSNSIISALEGNYGDFHTTERTRQGELWINPLMTIYWCFDLRAVVMKNKYFDLISNTDSIGELNTILWKYRNGLTEIRQSKQIPI